MSKDKDNHRGFKIKIYIPLNEHPDGASTLELLSLGYFCKIDILVYQILTLIYSNFFYAPLQTKLPPPKKNT